MKGFKRVRDVLFGSLLFLLLYVTPVSAGGPTEQPEDAVISQQSEETGSSEQEFLSSNDSESIEIYTIRIDLGEQWAGAKFYLDTDSGRTEYVADLLGGISFKVTDASESYTISPKIQAPPSLEQEIENTEEESSTVKEDVDSTENVGVVDGSSIGSIDESSVPIEEAKEENTLTEISNVQNDSQMQTQQNNDTVNDIVNTDPVKETLDVLEIVIIVLFVIAIGAILGLVISRIMSAVRKKKAEKEQVQEEPVGEVVEEEDVEETNDEEEEEEEEDEI